MMNRQALEDVKILDFTWVLTGPLMTKYLADYGATVVRIESQDHPCFLRTSGPFKNNRADPDNTGYFAFYNPNKYSMSLKLDHPKGLEVARRLISWADIVAESFVPGTLSKLGLDYESLKKIKPNIIMISCSGQGQTGPAAAIPIAGNWLVALTGICSFSGWPDREPIQPFGPYTDFIAPRFGAVAMLAALRHKRRTGKGQYIDLSQLEAGIQFLSSAILDFTVNGRQSERMGNASPCAAPHGVYPCLGGKWCAISVSSDAEWKAFRKALKNLSWCEEPRFATFLDRKKNENELNQLISEWTTKLCAEEVMRLMQEEGISAGVVKNSKDLYEDEQLRYRNHLWTLDHKVIGKYEHLGQAAILSKTPARGRAASPCLGEHTEYVCREFLNMPDVEFVELLNEGVFGI